MNFRTVVITSQCKLSYKDHFLVVRAEDVKMIHLSEIDTLILDTTMVSITAFLLCELMSRKINVVFCNEKHHPHGEVLPLYGCHNTSKKVLWQMEWDPFVKKECWTRIVKEKIRGQAALLNAFDLPEGELLLSYLKEIEPGDETNREGHAAKVYFHSLFGVDFNREKMNDINGAMDYGYMVLLSLVNREVVANGYITQAGIGHRNEFNHYNLSSDLMEPLRGIVDSYIFKTKIEEFTKQIRLEIIGLLNLEVYYGGKQYNLNHAVKIYVKNTLKCITEKNPDELLFIKWQ